MDDSYQCQGCSIGDQKILLQIFSRMWEYISITSHGTHQYGATIKHVKPHHIANIPIPIIEELKEKISEKKNIEYFGGKTGKIISVLPISIWLLNLSVTDDHKWTLRPQIFKRIWIWITERGSGSDSVYGWSHWFWSPPCCARVKPFIIKLGFSENLSRLHL